jgi:alpha-ketoglutarate-dependent taurine dioxygenase
MQIVPALDIPLAPSIPGVSTRFLDASEASNPGAATDLVLVVEPTNDASAELLTRVFREERYLLLELLMNHGNVLFRGFDVSPTAFEQIVDAGFDTDRFLWMFPMAPRWARALLQLPIVGWLTRALLGWIEGAATGRALAGDKQSTLADDQTIQFPHHEYGIFFNVPHVLAFYCEEDAEREGETLLCDAKTGFEDMPDIFRHHFEQTDYIRYRSENQWYLPPFTAPAILHHPIDNHPSMNFTAYRHDVFANVAKQWFPDHMIVSEGLDETFSFQPSFRSKKGDYSELSEQEVVALSNAHLRRSVLLRWQKGDLMLMDNFRVLHGRLNAGLPKKKVLQLILCDYIRNENHFTW